MWKLLQSWFHMICFKICSCDILFWAGFTWCRLEFCHVKAGFWVKLTWLTFKLIMCDCRISWIHMKSFWGLACEIGSWCGFTWLSLLEWCELAYFLRFTPSFQDFIWCEKQEIVNLTPVVSLRSGVKLRKCMDSHHYIKLCGGVRLTEGVVSH
jgi:hypothetical protein